MDPLNEKITYFNNPYHKGDIILKGAPDYKTYVELQSMANEEKMTWVYVNRDCIQMLANYLNNNVGHGVNKEINLGLCHGTRRGLEQKWFREELKALGENPTVIGTEIAPTAKYFPDTIQWDFHEVKDEWIGKVDFIYSNSFDHSYDPVHCLKQWMKCLRPDGVCIIEWAFTQTPECYRKVTCSDFFWATQEKLTEFFQQQNVIIVDILVSDSPKKIIETGQNRKYNPIKQERTFYVLKNK